MVQNEPVNIEATLREYIQSEIVGAYTVSMVIVKEVNTADQTCEVVMKYEQNVLIDSVPIASPFIGDGYGAIFPIEKGDEGFVLHNRRPIDIGMANLGPQTQTKDIRQTVEDAILFPMVWNGDMTIPDHEKGEMLIAHDTKQKQGKPSYVRLKPDGTIYFAAGEQSEPVTEVRLKPDGSVQIKENGSGNVIEMADDGSVMLGDPSSAKPVLNKDAVIENQDTGDSFLGTNSPSTVVSNIKDAGTKNVNGK